MRRTSGVIASLALVVLFGFGQPAHAGSFGAIAYSPSTGSFGYSFGRGCAAEADMGALQNCNGLDRRVVVWVGHGYAALATNNKGGYGAAWSNHCQADADRAALNYAGGGGCGAHILCRITAGI